MKKAGLVVAIEMDALKRKFGEPIETIEYRKDKIYKYISDNFELYAIRSGVGEIAASASAELLINKFDVDYLFNFGVVGGLTEEISKHRICVVESVVHYDFDTSPLDHCEVGRYIDLYPTVYIPTDKKLLNLALAEASELKSVICCSGDKFVDKAEDKIALHEKYNADICEMEAAGITLTANRNGIPCLLIKMVSDSVEGGAEEFTKELQSASDAAIETLAKIMNKL
jgi:adenosylhomocysteine nucleosidase